MYNKKNLGVSKKYGIYICELSSSEGDLFWYQHIKEPKVLTKKAKPFVKDPLGKFYYACRD